jgi:hypothetical protein
MRSCAVTAAVLAFGTSLTGCAATTTTNKVAVDYNRFFARSRDEVLVTNILRASAREPLQFSTMGTVTGGVRNSGAITIPFTNLIGGTSGLTISPSATLNDSINPNITIVPLGDKEFTEGILKPVSLDTLNYFFNQGWDPEMILPLVVGGIICKTGEERKLILNRGIRHKDGALIVDSSYDKFIKLFATAPRLPIKSKGEGTSAVIRLPTKDGIALLKDGIKDRKIDAIVPVMGADGVPTAEVLVTVVKPAGSEIRIGEDPSEICKQPGAPVGRPADDDPGIAPLRYPLEETAPPAAIAQAKSIGRHRRVPAPADKAAPKLEAFAVLRSVESIIYFLGETQRDMWQSEAGCGGSGAWPYYSRYRPETGAQSLIVLRLERACTRLPIAYPAFALTKFNDNYYYVRRAADSDPLDRSLTTLTFLNELIALQVSGSTITSSAPVIAVGAR